MSAISPSPISTRITTPLRQVATRQWTVLAARGIVQTLVISLAVLLLVAVPLGFFEGMHVVLRVALAGMAWATIICTTVFCLKPALNRWNLSRAALVADKSLPDSEERISSAIELSEAEHQFRGSPELVAHLIKQAEEDASRVDATEVIPFSAVFVWAAVFVPVIAMWAVSMHFWPQLVGRGLYYSVMPMRPAPGILTPISVQPDKDQVAIEGGKLKFTATVTVFNGKAPKNVDLLQTFDSTGASKPQALSWDKETRSYTGVVEPLQQSFTYKISTDLGDSLSSFHVTVLPRPKISAIDVKYQYPKYASQYRSPGPAQDINANVSAVVGSKVTLSVHALIDPRATVVAGESSLVINEGKREVSVPLAKTSTPNVFEAQLDLKDAGKQEYRLNLTTTQVDKAGNVYKDEAGAVLKPTNTDVGPYTAEAVADQPPTIAILAPHDMVTLRPIDDASVIFEAGDDFGVDHVEILVGVDGRPDHTIPVPLHAKKRTGFKDQWVLSVPAILKLDGVAQANSITFQLRATDNRDPDPQYTLTERRTIYISQAEKQSFQERLNEQAKEELEKAIKKAIDRLTSDSAVVARVDNELARGALTSPERVTATGQHVATTGTDLSATAAQFLDTQLGDLAKKAQAIADNEIKTAAGDTNSIVKSNQRAVAERAHKEIIDARDKLQALLAELQEAAKKAEALQALKDAAKKQEEVAKAMAEHPENVKENKQQQQDAINKLQEAIRKDPQLQDAKAVEQAKALAELENKIEKDQQKQTDLQNQTAKQEEQQQAQQAANEQAEAQKKLNEEIKKFAQEEKKPLDQANAQVPDQAHQDQLVKNIENNQLQQAAQQAQDAAEKLKQDAQKLDKQAQAQNAAKPAANPDQQKQQQQDQQNQQQAKAVEKLADQAAAALKKDAAQDAPKADAAQQAAQNTEKAAQQIEKQADKIEQQNQQGAKDPDVQKAAEAAKADAQQAAQDAKAAADAAKADNAQDAKQDAAQAAQELAKAAQELNQAAQAEAKADQAQAQAQQAQAKADQAQAQQAAAQAADQAKALAQKQQEIAQALAQQAQQQADAQQNAATPAQAAEQQKQLAQDTQQAQNAAQQLAQQAQANKDAQLAQRADQAAKALDQAAKDQQQAAQADAAAKPAEAAQAQADAQQALNKAQEALHGAQPDAAQAQAQPADPAAQAQAAQAGQPENGQPQQGQPQAGQPQQTAAQAAAEAAQAQQQALQQGNPAAAAEAAQALAQAAQAAEQGHPGQEAGNEPGNDPGNDTGTQPHQATDPKQGITGSDAGGDNKVPASVEKAIGISASDWAKLRDRDKLELQNASLQGILPAYKEQVKNYYIRRAQMETEHAK